MPLSTDWIVSVDDHIVEAPDLWTDRLPVRYRDVGPRVVRAEHGFDLWVYEDTQMSVPGVGAIIGRDVDDWSLAPLNYDQVHPSCYDPAERLKAMDTAGILAQTNFPTFPRFCGQTFLEGKDRELALLCIQAWNDHILEEWCGAAPGRFVPLAMVPLWDPLLAAREAERAVARGARGILFSENPARLGLPSIHDADDHWDPLFSFANETGLPICTHIGSSSHFDTTSEDAPAVIRVGMGGALNSIKTLWDWMFSGHFFRYPDLKLVLSEGQIGWMPYMLHWMDHTVDRQRWARTGDFDDDYAKGDYLHKSLHRTVIDPDRPPSSLFPDHVFGCVMDDPVGIGAIDLIGVDNVMLETDFPHSDGSWPHSLKLAHEQLAPLGAEGMAKVMHGNACRVFQFTPAEPPTTGPTDG